MTTIALVDDVVELRCGNLRRRWCSVVVGTRRVPVFRLRLTEVEAVSRNFGVGRMTTLCNLTQGMAHRPTGRHYSNGETCWHQAVLQSLTGDLPSFQRPSNRRLATIRQVSATPGSACPSNTQCSPRPCDQDREVTETPAFAPRRRLGFRVFGTAPIQTVG